MAFTTKGALKTVLTNELARSDLTSHYDDWIKLAEADIRRDLRKRVVVAPLTLDSNPKPLPATCETLRAIRFNTASFQHSLDMRDYGALAALRRTGTGRPVYGAVLEKNLYLDVTPEAAYVMEIAYEEALTALAADGDTNTTLTESPDLYLYATLKHSAPFLEHDERIATWQSLYTDALTRENVAREKAELGAVPMSPGLPVKFG